MSASTGSYRTQLHEGVLAGGAPTAAETRADEPVFLRGQPLRAEKHFLATTHRICSPEETLERCRPLLAAAGITRVADITGLDRIGIPVVQALRPNGKSLSNSSGKGFTLAAATASAVMEGIEMHHAEECPLEPFEATWRALDRQGLAVPREQLPLSAASLFHPDVPELWVLGFDLIEQRELAVPFESVLLGRFANPRRTRSNFPGGSNGIASGNHMLEALCMGLAEVIERDAMTLAELRAERDYLRLPRIDLDSIPYAPVLELVARLRETGVVPVLHDCTSDTGVTTCHALLFDEWTPHIGLYSGQGAHLDPEVAMIRALTEAVQGRAVYIAGTRDDYTSHDYQRIFRRPPERLWRTARQRGTVDAHSLSMQASPSFEQDCGRLVAALRKVGVEHAVVCDLSRPEFGLPVVRIIVPALENADDLSWSPGPRARALLRELGEAA